MKQSRQPRGLWVLGILLFLLPSCSTWYSSIHQDSGGKIVITGNRRAGLVAGGPQAQLWIGTYDSATKTLTLEKVAKK